MIKAYLNYNTYKSSGRPEIKEQLIAIAITVKEIYSLINTFLQDNEILERYNFIRIEDDETNTNKRIDVIRDRCEI